MFRCLIILFLIPQISWSITDHEIFDLSKSPEWLRLLYYENDESIIVPEDFFLSVNGKVNPKEELIANIEAFQKNRKHKSGELAQCVFQARFMLLKSKWPNDFETQKCNEFSSWKKAMGAGDLYIVFASSYPSNPASMFGHTFFRFDRKNKGTSKNTKELIGYSMAIQARVDSNENPFIYTLKGLTGGYYAYLDIQPYYQNIGVYNNSESRDLWEYKIPISEFKRDLLIAHTWELSVTGAFEYFFFDENCSTYLLKIIEAIDPQVEFSSKNDLFVVPQVTLREVIKVYKIKGFNYRPSIKKNILTQINLMNHRQKDQFSQGKSNQNAVEKINDTTVLDTLVDYWKFENYKKKTKLSQEDKKLMYNTLLRRSSIESVNKEIIAKAPPEKNPVLGHKLSKVSLGQGENVTTIGYRYGFHTFNDPDFGFSNNAYLKLMDFNYFSSKDHKQFNLDIAEILSLEDFNLLLPSISWKARASVYGNEDVTIKEALGGVGLSKSVERLQAYSLLVAMIQAENENHYYFGLEFGLKLKISESLFFNQEVLYNRDQKRFKAKLNYNINDWQFSLNNISTYFENKNFLEVGFYF